MRRSLVALLFGLGLASSGPSALGQPAASMTAESLLRRAVTRVADGSFREARALLGQALTRTRESATLGQVHFYLGLIAAAEDRTEEARLSFRRALSHAPHLRADPHRYKLQVVALFDEVRRALAAERTPRTEPAPRAHRTEARPRAPAAAKAPPKSPPPPRDAARPARRRIWTWVAGAAALASAAVAIGVGLAARSDRDAACELLAEPSLPCAERTRYATPAAPSRYEELHASMGRKLVGANVAWALAGVLTAGAVVLFWLEGRTERAASDRPPSARAWRVLPQLGAASGLSLDLSY